MMSHGRRPAHGDAGRAGSDDRCRCCGGTTRPQWRGPLLDLEVQYFECPTCAFVQTESPYWLDRAYTNVINQSDTGLVARNQVNARVVLATLALLREIRGRVVDCAGGYGLLVRLLRDHGVDALWSDPYCENLMARGFEHDGGSAALVTSFEAFEHFVEPEQELAALLAIAPNVLLSTTLLPVPAPPPGRWWYYGTEHGQHVSLYRARSLELLARRLGKHFATDGTSYHLIADRPVSHRVWKQLVRRNRLVAPLVARRLASRTWTDHLLAARRMAEAESATHPGDAR